MGDESFFDFFFGDVFPMKTQRLQFWAALAALVPAGVSPSRQTLAHAKRPKPQRKWKTITYKVRKGDTLNEIAQRYHTTPAKIKRWNKRVKPNALQIGQKLRIVVSSNPPDGPDEGAMRLQGLSQAGGPKEARDRLRRGDGVLCKRRRCRSRPPPRLPPPFPQRLWTCQRDLMSIPVITHPSEVGEAKEAVYISQFGDNVGTVAMKFELDTLQLMEWNALTRSLNFEPGTPLKLKFDEEPKLPEGPIPCGPPRGAGGLVQEGSPGSMASRLKKHPPSGTAGSSRASCAWARKIKLYVPATQGHGHSTSVGAANRGPPLQRRAAGYDPRPAGAHGGLLLGHRARGAA